jgi:DNA-directed RNA polymerase subunit RPC12/RpoP
MTVITCSSCQKPLSIDENKLPMREVAFPCPVCKSRLTVDRRTLAAPPPPGPVPGDEAIENGDKALIVGVDDPRVVEAARALGFHPVHFATAEEARNDFFQEYPQVAFLRPAQVAAPPMDEMLPLTSLNPADRRKIFLVLVAENLRTFDGNAAFLYGVDLVVSLRDIGSIRQIYGEAEAVHRREYQAFRAVEKAS